MWVHFLHLVVGLEHRTPHQIILERARGRSIDSLQVWDFTNYRYYIPQSEWPCHLRMAPTLYRQYLGSLLHEQVFLTLSRRCTNIVVPFTGVGSVVTPVWHYSVWRNSSTVQYCLLQRSSRRRWAKWGHLSQPKTCNPLICLSLCQSGIKGVSQGGSTTSQKTDAWKRERERVRKVTLLLT